MKVDKKNTPIYNRNKCYSIFFIGFSFFAILFSCPAKQLVKNTFQQHSAKLQGRQFNNHFNNCSIYTQVEVIKYQESFLESFPLFLYSDYHYYNNGLLNPSLNKTQTFFSPGLYKLPLYLSHRNLRI